MWQGNKTCQRVVHWRSWMSPCEWSLNGIYLMLPGERHCLFIKPVNFGQLATLTFWECTYDNDNKKFMVLYEINSNIAHLQLGWRKKKNETKRVNLHIKKAYRWVVITHELTNCSTKKMLSFLNKAFQF